MADYTLGSLGLDNVQKYNGFDRPSSGSLTQILDDGSGAGQQVLQESGTPLRQAEIRGLTYDPADIDYLRGLRESRAAVVFTDCDDLTIDVRILELTTERGIVGQRFYDLTLIEAV